MIVLCIVLSLGVCCTLVVVPGCSPRGLHLGWPLRKSTRVWVVPASNRNHVRFIAQTTVPVRGDGLGIAIRRTLRLPAEARREIAQFRGRGSVRPLQPAFLQEKDAPLLDGKRGDHLHTEHRDPAIKWCKSCPARHGLAISLWDRVSPRTQLLRETEKKKKRKNERKKQILRASIARLKSR